MSPAKQRAVASREAEDRAGARTSILPSAAVALAALVALGVHVSRYLPFIADDALISLVYARRLLEGHGLTWSDGQVVEGYSNLLWVLLCAALGGVGLDLIDAARVLGLVSAGLTLAAVVYAAPAARPHGVLPALAAGLALALAGPFAVWSIGGLEQPLLACLLAWALVLCYPLLEPDGSPTSRRWIPPGVLLALLCWTRPDGVLLAAAAAAGLVIARGPALSAVPLAARLMALPVAATAAQLVFRLSYYGEWVPNSAFAKVGVSGRRLHEGLDYVAGGLWALIAITGPAVALLAVALRARGRSARRARFLTVPLAAWLVYVVAVGGDIFPARRHLVPGLLILVMIIAEGLTVVAARGRRVRTVAWLALPVVLALLIWTQARDAQNLRAIHERWEWDGEVIGKLLRTAFVEQTPLLAADPGGTLPYFSGLPSVDMLGINDHYLAHNRPAGFGRGPLGHELGNGAYVLRREPDLVLFCGPSGGARPCFRAGHELVADPTFLEDYRLVSLEGLDPHPVRSKIWARIEGGRIGVSREPGRVTVPGFLMALGAGRVARLDREGRLGVRVTPGSPAAFPGLELETGRWEVRLDHSGPQAQILVRRTAGGEPLGRGTDGARFELQGPGDRVDLLVAATPEGPVHVREVVLIARE